MPQVYVLKFDEKEVQGLDDSFLAALPQQFQERAASYAHTSDRIRFVLSRHLTAWVLSKMGYPGDRLYDRKTDAYNRPVFDAGLDLNNSHSGNYIVCACSTARRVGVDIEKIQVLDNCLSNTTLHENEIKNFSHQENEYQTFYRIWTKKEAVTKANGKGIHLALHEIDTTQKLIICEGVAWKAELLTIDPAYSAHVAYSAENEPVALYPIGIQEIFAFAISSLK
jgi:4'-phosphopantetheinyl transferase